MEVFPLEDVGAASDVGGPAVSQVEQMKSWDDSFTQLEKALQAAYETKETRPDISNFACQIPSSLTVSTSRSESPNERHENKRKWGDIYSPESEDYSKSKFKRTTKLLPGGVTITLLDSPKENSDVSDTVMRLVSEVKDFEQIGDVKNCQTDCQNTSQCEKVLLCNIPDVGKTLPAHALTNNSNLFENKIHGECSEDPSPSQIPASDEVTENSPLLECNNYSAVADQDASLLQNKTDSLTDTLQKDSKSSDDDSEHLKTVDSNAAEVSDNSIWDSILQKNEPDADTKTQETEGFSKSLEESSSFQSASSDHEEQIRTNTKSENNCEQEEQPENSVTKEEQSEKSSRKDDILEKNSKKDDKLKKKKFERCNIRDIKLEDELDAVTLSAQKEEQERIKRLQEAQMRALQERLQIIEVEKEALTQLFSQPTTDDDPALFSSSHNVEASEQIDDKTKIPLIKSETDVILLESSDEDKKRKLEEIIPTPCESEENVIDISSSSSEDASDSEDDLEKKDDDIMVLSDDGEADAGPDDPNNSGAHTNDCFNLPDHEGRVLVNVGHPPEDPDIFLAPQIAKVIKPHQIGGIRFLYDNVVENLERYKSSTGFGCILAHSMGLGKTVQVVSFVDVFLRHTPATFVLCIVPINTIQNWKAEFDMWVPPVTCVENEHVASGEVRPRDYNIYTLNENFKTMAARASLIAEWRKESGVLLMGYEMYRMLALRKMPKIPLKKGRRLKKQEIPSEPETCEQIKKFMDQMYEHIVIPGPDLVICDEGHRIKNSLASTSMALKSIKTRRRVVLTGYPLQNNLLEYWCMVDFVRPNYLGSRAEFCNMFERPISNGQCIDSTPRDRQLMRFRSHVLHSLLVGFVQRRGHSVLRAVLPKKEEHVLLIRMTPIQRKLYKCFVKDLLYVQQATNPLKLFAVCCKIWNHPDILYKLLQEKKAQEDIDLDIDLNPSSSVSSTALMKKKALAKDQMKSKTLQRPLKCPALKMSAGDLNIQKTELLPNSSQTCKMLGKSVAIKIEGQSSENVHLNQQNSQQLLEMTHDSESPLCKEEYPLTLHSSGTQSSQNPHTSMQHEPTHNQFSHTQYSQNNTAFCTQGFSQSSNVQSCQSQLSKTSQYGHQSQNQQYSTASQQPFQQQFVNSSHPQSQYLHQLQNNYSQPSNGPPQGGNQPYPQPPDGSPQIGNSQQFSQNAEIQTPSINNQYSQALNETVTGVNNKNRSQPSSGSANISNNQQFSQPSGRPKMGNKLYSSSSNRSSQLGSNQFSQSTTCSSQGGSNHFSQTSNVSPHGGNNQQFPQQSSGSTDVGNNHFAQAASVSPQLSNNQQYPQATCGSADISNFASPAHVPTQVGNNQLYPQPSAGSSQEVNNQQFSQSSSGSSQVTNKQPFSLPPGVSQVGGSQSYPQSSDSSAHAGNGQPYPSTAVVSSQVGTNQQFSQHSSVTPQVGNNQQFSQTCPEQSQIGNNQPQISNNQSLIGSNQQFLQQCNEPAQVGNNQSFPQPCNEQPQIGNQQYPQQPSEQSQIGNNQQCTQISDGPPQGGNNQLYQQQLNGPSQILTDRSFPSQHPFPMQVNSQRDSNFTSQPANQDNLHQKLPQFTNPTTNSTQYNQQFPPQANQAQMPFNQESTNPTCPMKHPTHLPANSQSNFNPKAQPQYLKNTPHQQYPSQSVTPQDQQYAPNQLRQHGQPPQQIQKYNDQTSVQHKRFSDKHDVQQQYTEQTGGEAQQCHDNAKTLQKYSDHSIVQQTFAQHSSSQSQYSQRPQSQPTRAQQAYSQPSASLDTLPSFSHPSPNQKVSQQASPQHFTQQPSPQFNQQSSPMQSFSQCSPVQHQFPQQSPPLQQSPSQSQYSLPSPTQTYPQFPQQSSNQPQYLPQSSHQYPQESSPHQQYSQTQYNNQSSSQQYPQHSSPQQQFQQQSPKQAYGQQFLQHGQQYPRQPSPHQNFIQQSRQPPFHIAHQQQYNQNVQPYKSNINTSNFTPQSLGQGPHFSSSQIGSSHQYGSQQQQQLSSRQPFPTAHNLSDPYSMQIPQPNSPQMFNPQPVRNSSPPQYCQSQPTTASFSQPSSPPSPSYSQQSHQNKQYQQSFIQQNTQSSFQQYQSQLPQSMQPPQQIHPSTQSKSSKQPLVKSGKSLSHVNLNCQAVQSQSLDHSTETVQSSQFPNFQNNLQQTQSQNFTQTAKSLLNASNQNYQPIHEPPSKKEHFTLENIKEEPNVSYSKSTKAVMTPVKNQTPTPQTSVLPYQQVQSQDNSKIESDTPGAVPETVLTPCRDRMDSSISYEWAIPLMKEYVLGVLENSHKMIVLFAIIDQTLEKGDKLLVFSQSLSTLDLLEHFLGKVQVPKCYAEEINPENWCRNKNYFRLDGSTSAQEREKLINEFNRNENISLFLLSTRAGCLGINLVGANRIVVMDASWNPCHDAQAVCRIYRYGQKKQCHIYRLVTDNSLEKRIYDRQVNKQGMSDRVVDELNPESNFTWKDVTTLIQDDEDDGPIQELIKFESSYSDDVLKYLVSKMGPSLSKEPFEHESLLLDRKDLKLTKQEKRLAKQSYEMAKRANMINIRTTYTYMPGGGQFIINNKQGQWVGGTTVRVLPGQSRGGGRPGTTATPITASPSLMNSLFKQGVMVQKLTIPSNISIPVLTPGAPPVVIPAGQDVLVLRTPKGVYLRLPDGRIIAVQLPPSLLAKTQFRPNVVTHFRPNVPKGNQSTSNNPRSQSIGIIKQTLQCGGTVRLLGPKNASNSSQNANRSSAPEIIDLSDDEEPSAKKGNLSNISDETDSSASEQDQNSNKQSTTILPGKQITIRRVSPALQQNSVQLPSTKEKCDLPIKLQQNQQITIMPINANVQQSRQKLAPQLAQPVRVQQMLLQPQQGKRKPLSKNTTKIQMTSYPVNKNFQKQQVTVTPTQNVVQIQKLKQTTVHQSPLKTLDNHDQSLTISSSLKNPSTSPSVPENSEKMESYSDSNISIEHIKPSIDNKDLCVSPAVTANQEKLPNSSSSITVTQFTADVSQNSSHSLTSMSSSSHINEKKPTLLPQTCENLKPVQQTIPVSSVESFHIQPNNFAQLSSSSMTISPLPQTISNSTLSNSKSTTITSQSLQNHPKLHQHQTFVDSQCFEGKPPNVGSSPPHQSSFQLSKISDLCSSSDKKISQSPSKLSRISPPQPEKVSSLQTQFTEITPSQNTSAMPKLQTAKPQADTKADTIESSVLNSPKNLQNEMMTVQKNLCSPQAQQSPLCFENTQNGQITPEIYMQQQLPHFHHSGLRPPLMSSQTQLPTPTRRKKSTSRSTLKKSQQQQVHTPLDIQGNRQNPSAEPHQFPCSPISDHLHDHRFQPFSHTLQNSDFPPFQNYATHKNLLHIQHPQPLHPLQHNQEHSLASHLSHMPHIYPMSPHMTGNPCISDIQPQGPRAWPVPQSSMSSFHPFGQSSQYYSSSHDSSQYPFQPSSFSLSQPTASHVPQSESNAGVLDHVSSACPSEL